MNKVVLGLLVFISSLSFAAMEKADGIKAQVNEDIILESELNQRINEIRGRYQDNPSVLPPISVLEKQILEMMILESIQLQMAEKQGWSASEDRVNAAITNIANRNNMTLEQMQSLDEFSLISQQIERDVLINLTRQRFLSSRININPKEIDSYLDTVQGRTATAPELKIVYLRLDSEDSALNIHEQLQAGKNLAEVTNAIEIDWRLPDALPTILKDKSLVTLGPGEAIKPFEDSGNWHIAQLADKRSSQVKFVEQLNIRHILIKPSLVLEEESAKELAESLRERVLNGESFSELAKEYSEDNGSKLSGGDLGWSDPEIYVPAFREAASKLDVGETSEVIQTEFGFHFMQLLGKRQQDVGIEEIKESTYRALYSNRYNEELQRWLAEIRSSAFVDIRE